MLSRKWFRLLWLVAAVAVVLMVFAACNEEEETPTASPALHGAGGTATPAATGTAAAGTPAGSPAAAVPELADGVLQVGSDISYAPMEFFEEGTTTAAGMDVDLANALAEELGVTAEFINTGWDGIIPALTAERFDVIMSAMTITDERSKTIDFIPYFNAGTDILVAAGNPKNIQSVEDLSGLTVGVQIATIQVDQLNAANDDLKAAGKPEINVLTFDQNPLAVEQLAIGRADAVIADSPVVANDALLSDGELEAVGLAIEAAPYGIGVRKGSTELKAALEHALQAVMGSGKYQQVLETWSLSGGAIE
jgi:polar amino acid transport system substrate-binding protein